jgi:hypothetical protein
MASCVFDSHNFVKPLMASGFSAEQAETLVEMARDAAIQLAAKDGGLLLTKTDLQLFELRILIKFGGMLVLAVAVIAGIVKLA